jgi:xanthine dehydrogenase accessory factor
MATAAARLLFLSGFPVIVLERAQPMAVRRRVAFAEAVFTGEVVVEGVRGRLVPLALLAATPAHVAVAVDPEGTALARLRPHVLVDARMTKARSVTTRADAPLVIGLGPGFTAGVDAHAVVETQRGPNLGRVLWSGSPEPDSGIPAPVLGHTDARVLRAPRDGVFHGQVRIGDVVAPRQTVGSVGGAAVLAGIAGMVRGLLADGVHVAARVKVGDIDPRAPVDPAWLSDKGRAVAAGVLEAVLVARRSAAREESGPPPLR